MAVSTVGSTAANVPQIQPSTSTGNGKISSIFIRALDILKLLFNPLLKTVFRSSVTRVHPVQEKIITPQQVSQLIHVRTEVNKALRRLDESIAEPLIQEYNRLRREMGREFLNLIDTEVEKIVVDIENSYFQNNSFGTGTYTDHELHALIQILNKMGVSYSLPATPQPPLTKPMASYVHIAFKEELESGASGEQLYKKLPAQVQMDVMRHLFFIRLKGPMEERIETAFQKKATPHINHFYSNELNRLENRLRREKHSENAQLGEAILNDYYAGKQNSEGFKQKLKAFATDARFLQFVQDQASAASVKASGKDWALKHYQDHKFVHLTMQALERYLHTDRTKNTVGLLSI